MKKKRQRIRPSQAEKQWIANGRPIKKIKIPILSNIKLIEKICKERELNPDYALFLLYKILFSRKTAKKEFRSANWFAEGYTTLHSNDLQKWIGKNYPSYISLLHDIHYLEYKVSENGNLSYQNSDSSTGLAGRYRINPTLLRLTDAKNLFEKLTNFKSYQLKDYKLINKLYTRHIINMTSLLQKQSHELLAQKIAKVRFTITDKVIEMLTKNYNETVVADMVSLMDDINAGEIYVKRDLDVYGERFHSTLTFTWSILRQCIYFEDSFDTVSYLDIKNSQFYFFSQLSTSLIKSIVPEFSIFTHYLSMVAEEQDYKRFCELCASGEIYEYIRDSYIKQGKEFTIYCNKSFIKVSLQKDEASRSRVKTFLMQVLFSNKGVYANLKKEFALLFPSVARLIEAITNNYMVNFLPELLQKCESRVLLDRVAVELLTAYDMRNLVTIHDGYLFETADSEKMGAVLEDVFKSLSLSVPTYELKKIKQLWKQQ